MNQKKIHKLLALFLALALLTGCTAVPQTAQNTGILPTVEETHGKEIKETKEKILSLKEHLDETSKEFVSEEFLDFFLSKFGEKAFFDLALALEQGTIDKETWYGICKMTPIVLSDLYSGALDPESPNYDPYIRVMESGGAETVIRIVGDVSFADNWKIAPRMDASGKGVYGVLSEETVEFLKGADIFLLNNEFTYSDRGKPIPGKAYTFRANPARVEHLHEIGADLVSLANNHAYDYGKDAFADTLEILKKANVPYIGAGENIEEAAKPFYFIVNGRKYAFSAATKAEKYILTPEAGENSSGVMRTYNPEKYLKVIENAEKNCDYNIAYVHWGREDSHMIEAGLYEMAVQYIDAGADLVVGAHAHVLQGIEFYNSVPIVYNLGNFIFNGFTVDTGVLEIRFSENGAPSYQFVPAIQKGRFTQLVHGKEKERILKFMESLSRNVAFDENGCFSPKEGQ